MQLRFLAKSNAVLVHVHVSGNALRKNYALRKKLSKLCGVFFFYQIKHFEKKIKVRYEGT